MKDWEIPRFEEVLRKRLGVEFEIASSVGSPCRWFLTMVVARRRAQDLDEIMLQHDGHYLKWHFANKSPSDPLALTAMKLQALEYISRGVTLRTRPNSRFDFSVSVPSFSSLSELRMKAELFGCRGKTWTR